MPLRKDWREILKARETASRQAAWWALVFYIFGLLTGIVVMLK